MDQTPDLSQLLKIAQSPAGQQLIKMLQKQGGSQLDAAAKTASAGDFTQAQALLSSLLSTPEAKKLLSQLEGIK